jgi:hypothetical protein
MPCDDLPDDLNILWKEAGTDRPMFSLDQLRKDTERMQARRRRGYIVLAVCLSFFVACFALSFFLFHNTLTRIGSILGVFGFGYWLIHLLVERARTVPDLGETGAVRFYRAELERARDSPRSTMWRWLILPAPFILFDLGFSGIYAKRLPFIGPFLWFDCAFLLAVFAIWAPLKYLGLARKYQSRIDALDAAVRSSGP